MTSIFGDAIYRPLSLHDNECHQHFANHVVICSSYTEQSSTGEKRRYLRHYSVFLTTTDSLEEQVQML